MTGREIARKVREDVEAWAREASDEELQKTAASIDFARGWGETISAADKLVESVVIAERFARKA